MRREIGIPVLLYVAASYVLISFKPEAMFDPRTGAPRPFGANPAAGETLCSWWLAAFLLAYTATHLVIPHAPMRDLDW